jgi:hypothetical protein
MNIAASVAITFLAGKLKQCSMHAMPGLKKGSGATTTTVRIALKQPLRLVVAKGWWHQGSCALQ